MSDAAETAETAETAGPPVLGLVPLEELMDGPDPAYRPKHRRRMLRDRLRLGLGRKRP